jgi:phosphate starvation-inducible membrane PsiE
MPLLIVLFVAVAFLLAVVLLMAAGEVVSLPPHLSAALLYLLYFSFLALIATMLLEVISALAPGGAP